MSGSDPRVVTSSDFMGCRIEVAHVPIARQHHHSLVERLLAAGSLWGVQDDLWEWAVYEGAARLATDAELSEAAALEGARHWVRSNRPEAQQAPDADSQRVD